MFTHENKMFVHTEIGKLKDFYCTYGVDNMNIQHWWNNFCTRVSCFCWGRMHFSRTTSGKITMLHSATISVASDSLSEKHKQTDERQNTCRHSISFQYQSCCEHSSRVLPGCLALVDSKRQSWLQIHQTTSICLPCGGHWVRSRYVPQHGQSSWSGIWQSPVLPDCG